MATVLIVDDDEAILTALKLLLKTEGHTIECASSPEQALQIAKKNALDIALLDMNYSSDTTSGKEGLELIRKFQHWQPNLALVAMTGWSSIDLAVQCLQAGANDFIEKPWNNKRLISIIHNQEKLCRQKSAQAQLRSENDLLQQELAHNNDFPFVAHSAAMQALLDTVHKVAHSELSIFISGENGTGKNVLARYIHRCSPRKDARLVSVNTGAISENLFESDMFGHVKGAFTDAKDTRIGRFELADKGTLFLDEIGNLPLSQQAKLLRVLEEKHFEKVGSSVTQHADVRMISATNADLSEMLTQGLFRQDLLYRLNSIELHVPALRERREDIADLAQQLLNKACANKKHAPVFSAGALDSLISYDWPGNIRELSHVVERSVILCTGDTISECELQLRNKAATTSGQSLDSSALPPTASLEEIEKQAIERRIRYHKGNMSDAARSLGLSRSAFYRRLEKLQIH
ncbi:DNA-binding transcriptional response regulator, NtrC family, contains REC, AAA-type ATPase, and a Fis-type DNA-binding domains [Alteromonadaceae bacterium Bs31]|nr:DNA-binding transcriptional response regulator, NtrC family, contains REC, AAA-type ATPase, and a Fis-type DNA-binding domains [Alteromonadaceae bacterium Bs31]